MRLGVALSFAGLILTSIAVAADIPPPREVSAAALVAQLRSDSADEREAAVKRLSALEVVPAELSQALRSPESEMRKLAGVAVEAIRSRPLERLRRGQAFAAQGDVSLFVAATAKCDVPAGDPRVWDIPLGLAADNTKPNRVGQWKPLGSGPWRSRDYLNESTPETIVTAGRYMAQPKPYRGGRTTEYPQAVIVGEYETAGAILFSMVVIRQKATVPSVVGMSGVFCNASLERVSEIQASVVVCDGDIRAKSVGSSLVIARGNIRVTGGVGESILIAGGEITCDWAHAKDADRRNRFESQQSNPLGFVKFFELSRMGLEVTEADKVVRVKAVADGKAFAAGGAKIGDVVEGVNGTKPDSAESLRRLLRDALAVGDAAVTVRRGDAKHTLKVVLPE